MTTTTILVADADQLFGSALAVALAAESGLSARATTSADGVLDTIDENPPEILVLSAVLPDNGAAELCRQMRSRHPGCRILVLGERSDRAGLLVAFTDGAHGFLGKDCRLETLVEAVGTLMRGQAVVPTDIIDDVAIDLVDRARQTASYGLTSQEQRVLHLLSLGRSRIAIAEELTISPQTVRTHIQTVISKLGVHSRVQAVAVAFDAGLVGAGR